MPQNYPAEVAALQAQLLRVYEDAWRQVLAEQRRVLEGMATNPRLWRQRDRLAEVRQRIELEMANVDSMAKHWVGREYPKFYMAGAEAAAVNLASPFTWTQTHRDAVVLLAQDTMDDLLEATAHVNADTKRFLRAASKAALERGQLVGRTARQTAQKLAAFAASKGITAVTYANGARHGLADYAEMLVRTKTAVAYNVGTLNQGAEFGILYYEVFDGPSCGWTGHNDVDLANGSIRSAKEAAAFTIAHPRCARSFGPRPDLKTPVVAKGAKPTAGGQERDRPEAAQFPLEAAARTRPAREAAVARRTQAGLQNRARTPQRVLERRALMLQRGPGAAARGESGLGPQSRRKPKEPVRPADPFGTQLEGFDAWDDVMDRAWAKPGETHHLAWDGGSIEDLQLRLTRTVMDGEERTLVQFKLREDAKQALERRVGPGGGKGMTYDEATEVGRAVLQDALARGLPDDVAYRMAGEAADAAKRGGGWTAMTDVTIPRMNIATGDMDFVEAAYRGRGTTYGNSTSWKAMDNAGKPYVRFYRAEGGDAAFSFDGHVQAWLPGRATADDVANLMRQLGVEHLGYPTADAATAYARNRLGELFRVGRQGGLTEDTLEQALEGARRVFGITLEDVRLTTGHGGRVEVHLSDRAVKAITDKTGVTHFTHSLSEYSADGIAAIIESGALKSTTVRWTEGIGKAGQSSKTDVATGGADYVFVRQVTRPPTSNYSPTFVLESDEVLKRTDWFAYKNDTFGAQNPKDLSYADSIARRDNLRNLGEGANRGGNQETMFKHRLGFGPKDYLEVNRNLRDDILEALRRRGVTHVAGQPVEKFIRASSYSY